MPTLHTDISAPIYNTYVGQRVGDGHCAGACSEGAALGSMLMTSWLYKHSIMNQPVMHILGHTRCAHVLATHQRGHTQQSGMPLQYPLSRVMNSRRCLLTRPCSCWQPNTFFTRSPPLLLCLYFLSISLIPKSIDFSCPSLFHLLSRKRETFASPCRPLKWLYLLRAEFDGVVLRVVA